MKTKFPWLKKYLEQGVVVLIADESYISLQNILSTWQKCLQVNEKIVVLSVLPKPMGWNDCMYHRITSDEKCCLISLYYTYEFSDRFRLLSRQYSCGCFFNLVDTGYVNMDEALVAWLRG